MAETFNGLSKTELIKPGKPWRSVDEIEFATAEWSDWYNHCHFYKYHGDTPPVELETIYYDLQPEARNPQDPQQSESPDTPGRFTPLALPGTV